MKFKILLIAFVLISSVPVFAQYDSLDYVVKNQGDTTYVIAVTFQRKNGVVFKLNYYGTDGSLVNIEGRDKCEKITSFRMNGQVFDLIPIKPSKPKEYKRHMWKKIDGKIKVYEYYHVTKSPGPSSSTTTYYHHIVKLGNGKYYTVKQKNIDSFIKPYLLNCEKFKSAYKSEYSFWSLEFSEMIKLYNVLCEE